MILNVTYMGQSTEHEVDLEEPSDRDIRRVALEIVRSRTEVPSDRALDDYVVDRLDGRLYLRPKVPFGADAEVEEWAVRPIIVPSGPSILVVGPDGVGKTTICAQMSAMTGIPVWKCPSEKQIFRGDGTMFMDGGSLVFDYQLTSFLQQTGYRVLSDRAYACERVYARVFGRRTSEELLETIDRRHAKMGTRILYMHSSELPAVEDDLVPSTKYWAVKEEYDRFMEWTACDVVPYDTAGMLRAYQNGGDISQSTAVDCLRMLGEIE